MKTELLLNIMYDAVLKLSKPADMLASEITYSAVVDYATRVIRCLRSAEMAVRGQPLA